MAEKNLRLRVVLDLVDKALAPLKRISQGSTETAQTLKAARDQLKQLQATQRNVGTFRELRTGLSDTETKLKTARDKVRQLAASHAQAGPATKQMTAAMKAARSEAAQLGLKFSEQQKKVQQLRDKLAAAGIKTRDLASHDKQLRASITSTTANIDGQTAALKRQTDQQRRAAGIKQAQSANVAARGNARGALLDGVALAATLGAPIKMAVEWEQRLAELNKVANKTPQELGAIASAAQKLAVETGVAREEIIGAYVAASQAGFAESEWAQFAEVSAKMGVAFDTTGDKAGDMLKAWRSGMNLSMDQAALLAGAVNHIANSMNATANDIGGVMQRQGAYLSSMGLSQTQSAALAATMLSGGATEEIASTASKNFMKAMTVSFAATKSQLKVFDMLDVDPEKLAKQMQKAPEKAIVDVMKRLQKLAPDQLAPAMKMLFGDESIGPAAQIVKSVDGLVAAFEMVGNTSKYANSLQAEFDSMGNTTQQQMKKASEGVKTVTTALGMGLLPAINSAMATLAPMALQLSNWMQANQGTVTTIVSILAALIAFKIVAIAGAYAFTFLKGAWLSGRAALLMLRTNLPMVRAALQSTKAAALIAGRAVPAALTRMGLALKGLPGSMGAFGKSTVRAFSSAGKSIKAATLRLWSYIAAQKAAAMAGARRSVAGMGAYAAKRGPAGIAVDAVKGIKSMGLNAAQAGVGAVTGSFKGLFNIIKLVGRAMFMNPLGLAITALAGAALLIIKYWQPLKAFFVGFWQGLTQGLAPLSGMFSSVFGKLGGMLEPLRPVWDWLVGAFASVWGWVSRLFGPFQATQESLHGATQAGQGFGLWLAGLVVSVAELVGKFFGFGADIVGGMINGILSMAGALWDAVVGMADKIKNVFTSEVQIKSPSRVFMKYGAFISEGAANGISAGQAGVRAAALAMAGAAAAPVGAMDAGGAISSGPALAPRAGVSAPAAPSSYAITIHAAPGMDAQAIARVVRAEIENIERQKSSRGRSALHDQS